MEMLLMLVVFVGAAYFLMIRPQQKRMREHQSQIVAWPVRSTGRKVNWAVLPIRFTMSSRCTLGAETTMCLSPDVVTDASPIPSPSTRFWMMFLASSSESLSTVEFVAVRVMVMPP